jgi:hypothetical protein
MLLQVPHLHRRMLRGLALATMGTIVSSSGKGGQHNVLVQPNKPYL